MGRIMILLALASGALPSFAQRVRVDYDHACNFSRYKTYRWVELHETQSPDVQFPNQLMQGRIVGFLQEALAGKQLTRVETGGDVLVGYSVKVSAEPQFTTFTDFAGPGWGSWGWAASYCCSWGWGGGGWGSAYSTTTTQTIWTGTLVVSLRDARRNQLVFQGVSSDTISSRAEKNAKRLQRGICEMFEKYPPGK